VYLQAEPEYRSSADKINNFYVRSAKGEMTPLGSLVTVRRVSGPEYTNRFNLFRSIQINGSPAPGYSSGQAMAAIFLILAAAIQRPVSTPVAVLGACSRLSLRRDIVDTALEGARLRLRPILMTSFAFILGCVPFGLRKAQAQLGARFSGAPLSRV